MRKVLMVAMMVFMNTTIVMAASDFVSNDQQDVTLRNDRTQVELMGDKDAGSDNVDPTKAGVRV